MIDNNIQAVLTLQESIWLHGEQQRAWGCDTDALRHLKCARVYKQFLILGNGLAFFFSCVAITIRGDETQRNISLGDSGKCFSSREWPALMLDRSKLPD